MANKTRLEMEAWTKIGKPKHFPACGTFFAYLGPKVLSPTVIPPKGIAAGDSVATLSPTAIPFGGIAVGDSVATLSPTAIPFGELQWEIV